MVNGHAYRYPWMDSPVGRGTRLTNDDSVHGKNVSIGGVTIGPY
jgi:hypothetical protein